jgi:hypothetical protein
LQQIANLLIIYRLADGSAWKKDMLSTQTAIQFKSGSNRTNINSFHVAAMPGSSDPDMELKEARHGV